MSGVSVGASNRDALATGPSRIGARRLLANSRLGSDWSDGMRPNGAHLNPPTRAALEALWLGEARHAHEGIPGFARMSWLLLAIAAPANLVEGAHRAAMDVIAHARMCFALAAGYGGRSTLVEPLSQLLDGGVGTVADPLATLAAACLRDGCQMDDFHADIASACAHACREPHAHEALARIARDKRVHADLSWQILEWMTYRSAARVLPVIAAEVSALGASPRPVAVNASVESLCSEADPAALIEHGHVPDSAWKHLWAARLEQTRSRADALLRYELGTSALA